MKRVLSGIQPTGNLHLGNYLGALRNWTFMQKEYECFFCMVDLHALTTHPDPHELSKTTLEGAAIYLAAGIDPDKSTLFYQSGVPAHSELMWILSCFTPLGWLNRMTQFKEKSAKTKDKSVLGLYSYPVLMAADILLYQATDVPVGDDQKQHIEMTRDLAITINQQYDQALFTLPQPRIFGHGTRVMSLRDGTKKMSKTDLSEASRIHVLDTPDTIYMKIKKAKTDGGTFPTHFSDMQERPEIRNLITIYAALTGLEPEAVCLEFSGQNFMPFKEKLAEACITVFHPIQEKYHALMQDKTYVQKILQKGTQRANEVAQATLVAVKKAVGLL